jgi:polysaccharide deacetylase 2 family uncharacterized protein YibQ
MLHLPDAASAQTLGEAHSLKLAPKPDPRPRIALVIDDLGLDRTKFDQVNAWSDPVTIGLLPYGADAQAMADAVAARHEIILHLPMEPKRRLPDAGPDMVRRGAPAAVTRSLLTNLSKLKGYRGLNNHTGSAVTEDKAAMSVVLRELAARDLYFLDSRTSLRSVAAEAGRAAGAVVLESDFFLDGGPAPATEEQVRQHLALLKTRAEERGYAIAIGHPYPLTMRIVEDWMAAHRDEVRFVPLGHLAGEVRASRVSEEPGY